jgi:hypothetical protein
VSLGSSAMPASKERKQYFKTIQKVHLDYAPVTFTQYESTRTGMRVVVVDQVGPKVNGYFAVRIMSITRI